MPQQLQRQTKPITPARVPTPTQNNALLSNAIDPILQNPQMTEQQYMQMVIQELRAFEDAPGIVQKNLLLLQWLTGTRALFRAYRNLDNPAPNLTNLEKSLECLNQKFGQAFAVFGRIQNLLDDQTRAIGTLGAGIRLGLQLNREGFLLDPIDDTIVLQDEELSRTFSNATLAQTDAEFVDKLPTCTLE
jgi:hypothetical protein